MRKTMRKKLLLLALFVISSLPSWAAEAPRWELFGGYSYRRTEEANLHGWNASVAWNLSNPLGIVGDFSGHYTSDSVMSSAMMGGRAESGIRGDTKLHSFLFGPRFSGRASEKWTPFVHSLFGVANANTSQRVAPVNASLSENGFAMVAGGGVDIKVSRHISVRAIQAEYMLQRFRGDLFHGPRLSVGLVFH